MKKVAVQTAAPGSISYFNLFTFFEPKPVSCRESAKKSITQYELMPGYEQENGQDRKLANNLATFAASKNDLIFYEIY